MFTILPSFVSFLRNHLSLLHAIVFINVVLVILLVMLLWNALVDISMNCSYRDSAGDWTTILRSVGVRVIIIAVGKDLIIVVPQKIA